MNPLDQYNPHEAPAMTDEELAAIGELGRCSCGEIVPNAGEFCRDCADGMKENARRTLADRAEIEAAILSFEPGA